MEKLLPCNVEAEQGVLGSIILDPAAIDLVADFLSSEDFYRDAHRKIYSTIVYLYLNHQPGDFITICDELERRHELEEVGGASYITLLVNRVPTSGNVEYYGHIVEREAVLRRLIHAAGQQAADAYARDPEALQKAEERIYRISTGKKDTHVKRLPDALSRYLDKLEALHAGRKNKVMLGIPTGFEKLDELLAPGLQKSDLITLAARPGNGKTSMALNIARHAMKSGFRVLFFSLEMAEEQLIRRLLSMETHIDQTALRSGDIDDAAWDEIVAANDRLADGQLFIDDTAAISAIEMRSRARRVQSEHGLDFILADYIGLMKPSSTEQQETRAQQVSALARDVKGLARELDVPVLMLAQLSRAVEQRANKEPTLADLKESGGIEEHSDIVLFLHSDESQSGEKMKANPYFVNAIIAKHRNGPVGVVPLKFIPRLTQFRDA